MKDREQAELALSACGVLWAQRWSSFICSPRQLEALKLAMGSGFFTFCEILSGFLQEVWLKRCGETELTDAVQLLH